MGKSISETVNGNWKRLSGMPGGKKLFSLALGRMAPYSGTIGAYVQELRPGYARVSMKDRKKVRNHLNCVHAIALMNLGEIATGLATISGMPDDTRSILSGLSMEYLKKARGMLVAECTIPIIESSERREYEIVGEIKDASGEVVARATAKWLVGPRAAKSDGAPTSAAA